MPQLPKIKLAPPQRGIVRESAIDHTLVPENTVELAINMNFDRIGTAQLRPGLTRLGDQVLDNNAIQGMVNYINNAGDTKQILAKSGGQVFRLDGSSWTSVRSGLTSASKARFTNFLDLSYMVNGTGNEAIQTYNGTAFGTSNVASLPKGEFIENYRSRVWVAQSTTDKVFHSDVVTTAQTLTGGTSFIQISPQDGESITGLKRHPRALLVFKQSHIYRIFSINSADPDPSIDRGTYSQESIVETKGGIFYHHSTGFYQFVFDGQQREISRPIIDIIKAIDRTNYEDVVGWIDDAGDGDHIAWSVGDVTLDGVTFSNVVCRYTISTQVWTIYSTAEKITSQSLFDNGTTITNLVGDSDGNVLTYDSGVTDNGTDIFYDLQTHWIEITQLTSTSKQVLEIAAQHENAEGGNLQYKVNKEDKEWRNIGTLKEELSEVFNVDNNRFTRIRFRLSGNSHGSPFIFRGWEILNQLSVGTIKK